MHPKITPMLIAGLLAAVIATPSQARQEERPAIFDADIV